MFKSLLALCGALVASSLLFADEERAAERKKEIELQKKQAGELWESAPSGSKPTSAATDNFLVFGTIDEKNLEAIGKGLEKALGVLKRTAALKPDADLWPGKVVVHICKDRGDFRGFYLKYKKETPEKEELGTYSHERDATILVVATADPKRQPAEVEAVIQLAAATLTKKGGRLPDWFVQGFARAHAYRHAPNHFAPERQRARAMVRQGKTAKDIWTMNLSADEAQVLTASFFDFLMTSPQMVKTWPEILSLMGEETPFEDVLKNAKLMPDRVDAAWRLWAAR
jgi:hypothetical protein